MFLLPPILSGCQSRLLYFPEKEIRATPSEKGLPYEGVSFDTADRVRLEGWWVPSPRERGVLLFFHGNGGNISGRLGWLELFNWMGLSTFLFDYRGYGHSQGRPSEEGTYRDAEAAWRYLVETKKVPPERILLFGRSLGGSIAAWLAGQHPPSMLILDSAFTSLRSAARVHFPWLPLGLLLTYRYDTLEHLKGVFCPVLIISRRQDSLIPFSQGEELYRAVSGPKAFLAIDGTHNLISPESLEDYKKGLSTFVAEHLEEKER